MPGVPFAGAAGDGGRLCLLATIASTNPSTSSAATSVIQNRWAIDTLSECHPGQGCACLSGAPQQVGEVDAAGELVLDRGPRTFGDQLGERKGGGLDAG